MLSKWIASCLRRPVTGRENETAAATAAKPGIDLEGFNQLSRCRYGWMLSNRHDLYIGKSLQFYGEYCQAEADLLRHFLAPGQVVVDAGANVGSMTLFLAHHVGASGRVYAFEAQRIVFQTLCANLALNGLTQVHACHAALGSGRGRIAIDRPDYTQPNNFGGMELGPWEGRDEVDLMPLDDMNLEQCALIKIDVEGMEKAVLEGATALLRRCQPLLYVENDREEKSAALIACLASLGYRLYWHVAPYFNPDNFCRQSENLFPGLAARNMLCIPSSSTLSVAGLDPVPMPD